MSTVTIASAESGNFAVESTVADDRVVLRLMGELDCDSAPT